MEGVKIVVRETRVNCKPFALWRDEVIQSEFPINFFKSKMDGIVV